MNKKQKIIVALLDGIGDRSYKTLHDRTPLQTARTPNLDRLARIGANGLFHAGLLGQCFPSEIAHYLMFGYELNEFPGRGLLEASGAGIEFSDRDVLVLAHLSGVRSENGRLILATNRDDIAADRDRVAQLYKDISYFETHGLRFRLVQTRPNNAILIMSGDAAPFVSDTDPMIKNMPMAMAQPFINNSEPVKAARTAEALNSYLTHCHRVLSDHPLNKERIKEGLSAANFLATQRCGRKLKVESFAERWGLNGALAASGSVYGGIARELGMTPIGFEDTDDPERDLKERIHWALRDSQHDFIHVHTKIPDEAAHKTNPEGKATAIEKLDGSFDRLADEIESRDDVLFVITADHSTPSDSPLIHSGEPVPVVMAGPTIRRDNVVTYDEVAAASGCIGMMRGKELLLMVLNFANRSALWSHKLGPRDSFHAQFPVQTFKSDK